MTRWAAAGEAANYATQHPELSVGLHLDLGEWVYRAGEWVALYTVISVDDPLVVEHEIYRQLDVFHRCWVNIRLTSTPISTSTCANLFALLP